MRAKQKRLAAALLMFVITSALAIFFSMLLGRAYLGIMKSGVTKIPPPRPKTVPVTATKPTSSVQLTPVPVLFLQGGVYTELTSAQLAAEEFLNIGLEPFITTGSPYRLYIGFFGAREDADKLKDYLAEQEISVFAQSLVLNAKGLTYTSERAELVEKWLPHMEKSSGVIKSAADRFSLGLFATADEAALKTEINAIAGDFETVANGIDAALSKEDSFAEEMSGLADALIIVRDQMIKLEKDWTEENYNKLSKGMVQLVHVYAECWERLTEPKKT